MVMGPKSGEQRDKEREEVNRSIIKILGGKSLIVGRVTK